MGKDPLFDSDLSVDTLHTRTGSSEQVLEHLRLVTQYLESDRGPGSGPRLLFMREPAADVECLPLSDKLVVGRSSKADLTLPDEELSRRHFELTPFHGGWALLDLRSKNRLFVNNRRVTHHVLVQGDVIQAGDTCFVFMTD